MNNSDISDFEIEKTDGKTIALCLLCNKTLKNTGVKRLQSHRNVCEGLGHATTRKKTKSPRQIKITKGSTQIEDNQSYHLESSVDTINDALGRFFFGCNIPFSVVESKLFKEFVASLNPFYKPPTRKTLSGTILDRIHEDIQRERTEALENSESNLLIDGWKNKSANTKLVVCTIHNANEYPHFLKSYDLTGISETGAELTRIVNDAISIAKNQYKTKITAVVTDNASAMINMGDNVTIMHSTCNSHSGNLLAKSLVEKECTEKVKKVLKEFRNPALEKQLLEYGGKKIMLPCETRWCSYRDSFACLLFNLAPMRRILEERKLVLSEDLIQLILDEEFEAQVTDFVIIFDPICELINKCQTSKCNLGEAIELWLKLQFPTINESYEKILADRHEKVMKPIGLAANLLDPCYQGARFIHNNNYMNMAKTFITEFLNEDGRDSFNEYLNKDGVFAILFEKTYDTTTTFWESAKYHHPNLSTLALRLMTIPASTAQIERLFSNWAYVHNWTRNRLNSNHSEKLVDVYYSLRVRNVVK